MQGRGCVCDSCVHFRRHYIRRGQYFWPISDGHCVYPRLKIRKIWHEGCKHFQRKEVSDEDTIPLHYSLLLFISQPKSPEDSVNSEE